MLNKILSFCNKYFYWSLLLLLIIIVIVRCSLFDDIYFSLWDQSFLLFLCDGAYDGIITGKTQWDLICIKLFPYLHLNDIVESSYASLILISCTIINVVFSCVKLFGRQRILEFITVSTLNILPTIGGYYASEVDNRIGWGSELNYLVMQVFFLWSSLSFFLVSWYSESKRWKLTMLTFSFLLAWTSLFVIMPSGILFSFSLLILIVVKNWGNVRSELVSVSISLISFIIVLVLFHFFVANLYDVFEQMKYTAVTITKWNIGYTPEQFIMMVVTVMKYIIIASILTGCVYFLSSKINSLNHPSLATILYISYFIIAACLLQLKIKTPYFASGPQFICIFIIPLFANYKRLILLDKKTLLLLLFLFFFPVLSSIGTNTALFGRIGSYLISWLFGYFLIRYKFQFNVKKRVVIGAIIIMFVPLCRNVTRLIIQKQTIYTEYFTKGSKHVADISMSKEQVAYYDRIYEIIKKYNYEAGRSVMFASLYDLSTAYAFNCKLSSMFTSPSVFKFTPKSSFLEPDFIILNEEEKEMYDLANFDWGWPDDFDEYFIGNPETICSDLNWGEAKKRWLYCKKVHN